MCCALDWYLKFDEMIAPVLEMCEFGGQASFRGCVPADQFDANIEHSV
jgi:hypothetical protein